MAELIVTSLVQGFALGIRILITGVQIIFTLISDIRQARRGGPVV